MTVVPEERGTAQLLELFPPGASIANDELIVGGCRTT